jgi:hypothetical protein
MMESEYLEKRLEDQINWYSAKSSYCQSRYKVLRIIEIVLAAFIPFLSGLGDKVPYGAWIIGSLGVAITISTAAGSLFKYHENWIQYRATSEALKHEKYLYLAQVAPYDGANAFQVAVQRIEGLISNENSTWTQTINNKAKQEEKS